MEARMTNDEWKGKMGRVRRADGRWQLADSKWQMAKGKGRGSAALSGDRFSHYFAVWKNPLARSPTRRSRRCWS
jgi:hypothetical protein